MNASITPAASTATAAASPPAAPSLAVLAEQAGNVPLTRVSLAYIEPRFKLYLRFGEPARTLRIDRWRRCAVFLPNAVLCRIRWQANDYGTTRWQLMVMQAGTPLDGVQRIPGVRPGARLLLHAEGENAVRVVLERNVSTALRRWASPPSTCRPRTGARWATGLRRACRCLSTASSGMPRGCPEGAAMTAESATARTPETASHLRSRRRARIMLAGFAAVGLAALAWATFVQSLPRLIYNPSDSVPVGWYLVEPLDHRHGLLSHPLPVGSIVLTRLPAGVAALAAQRGYLPTHVPLLKRVGAVVPQHICIVAGQVRIDGVPVAAALSTDRLGRPLPTLQLCRRLVPGELFLLSVTNPASFDSRYFGPVSASAVIGVAHPVWLETRP